MADFFDSAMLFWDDKREWFDIDGFLNMASQEPRHHIREPLLPIVAFKNSSESRAAVVLIKDTGNKENVYFLADYAEGTNAF